MRIRTLTAVAVAFLAGTTFALAAANPTKDDAVAMVKKAVAAIKAEGAQKVYAEINNGDPRFVNGASYVVVVGLDGINLADPVNHKLIGKSLADAQDVDGKYFVRDMSALARKESSFWYDFKFVNPVTRKIQVKDMYCEVVPPARVCSGVYQQ